MDCIMQITNWKLTNLSTGKTFPAHVPGDITDDLYRCGEIAAPYYGENYKQLGWIAETDFEYEGTFVLSEEACHSEDISLILKGIDTFAEVSINDMPVCRTENMFVEYAEQINALVHSGQNTLRVRMRSTKRAMERIDTTGYFGVFNVPRLFVRKAQCHFGWDWAPDLCGYGIWQPVYVVCRKKHRIESVNYWADPDGDVTIFTELNYCINATTDDYGVAIDGTAEQRLDDTLACKVLAPDGSLAAECTIPVEGRKNFCNLHVGAPQLWWPNGYGAQPLYRYEVTLYRAGEAVGKTEGTLAFRKVELVQKPTGAETLGFKLRINDTDIFVRGSNWVPVDCFTGAIRDEKYERLLMLAKNGNCNLLRVWGGGIYERELFYDLCDREGILVWQDFMFACGDIPEDKPDWVENTLHECEQQIKRLRVHPCVVYWCGGNEKTGSFALQISRGDQFVDYTLHGLVKTFDRTRPYVRQSPFSYSDVGNNWRSGETHCNSFEPSLTRGIVNYRKTLNETVTSFYSECAVMGPNSLETFRKFMPEEKRWPMNDCWNDRLRDNPYAAILIPFAERQAMYVADMYGAASSLEDFTAKAMLIHAEMLAAEVDYARSKRGKTSGIINWMFSDIWPTGTWSIVDYYTEPKQAYYALRRAYAPLRAAFVQAANGRQELFVMNDTRQERAFSLEYGEKTIDGRYLWSRTLTGSVEAGTVEKLPLEAETQAFGTYLYAAGSIGDAPVKTLYSVNFWRNVEFASDYEVHTQQLAENKISVHIKAKQFAKSLFLSHPENYRCIYSDNYLDLEAGEEATVTITSDAPIDEKKIILCDYARMTAGN